MIKRLGETTQNDNFFFLHKIKLPSYVTLNEITNDRIKRTQGIWFRIAKTTFSKTTFSKTTLRSVTIAVARCKRCSMWHASLSQVKEKDPQ